MQGYIKLYRQMLKWEWYGDLNTKTLFIHCLLRANHEDKKWRGVLIKKGQFATSLAHLSQETGLSPRQIRTSLEKLKKTKNLTNLRQGNFTVITVLEWDRFQTFDKPLTNLRQTSDNKQTLKEGKEKEVVEEEGKTKKTDFSKDWYGEYQNVHLDAVQLGKLKSQILNDNFLNQLIEALSENIAMKKENAPAYDERYPWMHYAILKRYWQYRKLNPSKFKSEKLCAEQDKSDKIDKLIEEARKREGK